MSPLGMTSWREDGLAVERVERMTVEQLHERWTADRDALQVLDVREAGEWAAGHIPGSVHEPYHDIREIPGAIAIALALTMRTAVGTSLAIITATSLLGLAAHLLAGRELDVDLTAAMTVACAAGAFAGAAGATRLPQRVLGRAFAVLVACVAAYLLLAAAFLGGPPGAS